MAFETANPDMRGALNRRQVLVRMYSLAELFRQRLPLLIPACPLRIAPLEDNTLGQIVYSHTGDEWDFEITIDELLVLKAIAGGNWLKAASVVLHEQIHLHEFLRGRPRGHGDNFRSMALVCGLIVSEDGVNTGYVPGGPFLKLMAERGLTNRRGV